MDRLLFLCLQCKINLILFNQTTPILSESLTVIFVWMLNSKLLYTEKDCVVLYHLMVCGINLITIIFAHLRRRTTFKLFVATFSLIYVAGFALITATLRYVHLKQYLFSAAYISLIIGFAGTKSFLTDFLRMQISGQAYDSFCFKTGLSLVLSFILIGCVWPYILDLVPSFGQPDSYYISFAVFTCVSFLLLFTFNVYLWRNLYTINSNLRRERNFKYMVAVLLVPLYYMPKYLVLQCLGNAPKIKRHQSPLQIGAYFKYALYALKSSVVNRMVRIWRIVYLMAPVALYWAVTEQQHARLVFTTYHTDRRFQLRDFKFYLHPTQMQLLNPIVHLLLLPLLCYLIYPAMRPWPKRDRILRVGSLMSFALYLSATMAYRQTRGNTMPLTSKPRTIVTNIVSGLEVNVSMFAKYDIRFGIESKGIEPFAGSAINAPLSNPKVHVNFTMREQTPLQDFSVQTENLQEEIVQTLFFRRRDSLEIFRYSHHYIRPYDFTPTFRVYFANTTPLYEVTLLTPLGHRWLSVPMDTTPDEEYHIEPGNYRFTVNNYACPQPTIRAEYGAYYDAVVFTDGQRHVSTNNTTRGEHGSCITNLSLLFRNSYLRPRWDRFGCTARKCFSSTSC